MGPATGDRPDRARQDETLPKSLRLLRRRDFLRAQRQGHSGVAGAIKVQRRDTPQFAGRVGLTVSKKVGNAVARNRVKRRLRDVLRREKGLFDRCDLVVIALPGAATRSYLELAEDLRQAVATAQTASSAAPRRGPRRGGGRSKGRTPRR